MTSGPEEQGNVSKSSLSRTVNFVSLPLCHMDSAYKLVPQITFMSKYHVARTCFFLKQLAYILLRHWTPLMSNQTKRSLPPKTDTSQAIGEQFRRKGNVYFLVMGCIMALGYYTTYFDSSISPWTTLGPLAVVISISLIQEGFADLARHRSDARTNRTLCTVLERVDDGTGVETAGGHDPGGGRRRDKRRSRKKRESRPSDDDRVVVVTRKCERVTVGGDIESGPPVKDGPDTVQVWYKMVPRRNIRPGHLVLVQNRQMIPADLVLLASSGDNGGAYIETSSIDGETNLKLRLAAKPAIPVPSASCRKKNGTVATLSPIASSDDGSPGRDGPHASFRGEDLDGDGGLSPPSSSDRPSSTPQKATSLRLVPKYSPAKGAAAAHPQPQPPVRRAADAETLEQATERITNFTVLGTPDGRSALSIPTALDDERAAEAAAMSTAGVGRRRESMAVRVRRSVATVVGQRRKTGRVEDPDGDYVAMITCELPNASVNTFSGRMTLAGVDDDGEVMPVEVPLNADNFLLRGAFLRNTEWAIGVACFTGKDTKLVMNSSSPPSRLSQLDKLVNRTILIIIAIMMIFVLCLSCLSLYTGWDYFDLMWYLGYNPDPREKWPYLQDLATPVWSTSYTNLLQNLFLFTTLLNNFVPLSLYVTMEVVTRAMMLFINADVDMYYAKTDTPASARSTTVTDLGQIKYIFSDKTGTLTQNVMRFKRCSVDGMMFGAPIVKSAPLAKRDDAETEPDNFVPQKSFHPLRKLLVPAGIPGLSGYGQVASSGDDVTIPSLASSGQEVTLKRKSSASNQKSTSPLAKNLTFNAEMFLRVMSICHTVVVERDHDADAEDLDDSEKSGIASWLGTTWSKKDGSSGIGSGIGIELKKLTSIREDDSASKQEDDPPPVADSVAKGPSNPVSPASSVHTSTSTAMYSSAVSVDQGRKSKDGAPLGESYQAESPDEGALVSAASLIYGFQFLGRDSTGIRISTSTPSVLQHESLSTGLKTGTYSAKSLAAVSASPDWDGFLTSVERQSRSLSDETSNPASSSSVVREEVWTVLAVNKFDSTRKRMSVLVRSPPELGSIPMLLCKGADSAMLNADVCEGFDNLGEHEENVVIEGFQGEEVVVHGGRSPSPQPPEDTINDNESDEFETTLLLAIQAHLGDFASEGLRTLVLGVRILTEEECTSWLAQHAAAASSINKRDEKLTKAALDIERDLHIVGVTAIEDKLQKGVPETISRLATAGIKLWVLTGDKRETAIEIGYSTKVLTPQMQLFQVAEVGGIGAAARTRTIVANEFMRLVKTGSLPQYQHLVLDQKARPTMRNRLHDLWRILRRFWKRLNRVVLRWCCLLPCILFGRKRHSIMNVMDDESSLGEEEDPQKMILEPVVRRRAVRKLAEDLMFEYLSNAPASAKPEEVPSGDGSSPSKSFRSTGTDDSVFNRSASAYALLNRQKLEKGHNTVSLRSLSLASVKSHEKLVDEDALSMLSFFPDDNQDDGNFDKKKRTILERMFAVDSDVRHGRLNKHLKKSKRPSKLAVVSENVDNGDDKDNGDRNETFRVHEVTLEEGVRNDSSPLSSHGPKALIIEGAALHHLLGNPLLEEMIFSVASCCDAVIACRVSPKQKALLVQMVRTYVSPVPMTLAIGDGANDVGMIQEAHVGIGISGLEGQQAVNSSDFAIAQFRYLQELLLVHGRWNFSRMSRVVLFSFYKNAVLAGLLVVYAGDNLYSGQTLFDEWIISMFNFVCTFPILFVGLFDRDIEKAYIRKNPELYAAGPHNEELSIRKVVRWVAITLVQIFTIYFFSQPIMSLGGEVTSAWKGLMHNVSRQFPGDGEGDLYTFGTTIYTVLVFTLAYKALYETRSIINGSCPPCLCRKVPGQDPWGSRLPYTWLGVIVLSILFYLFALYLYEAVAKNGNSAFIQFTSVATHTFNMRSLTWMITLLVPITACVFDVSFKVFANFYFPTQTQIHMEIQAKERGTSAADSEKRRSSTVQQPGYYKCKNYD